MQEINNFIETQVKVEWGSESIFFRKNEIKRDESILMSYQNFSLSESVFLSFVRNTDILL